MKKYLKPSLITVELSTQETFASGSCQFVKGGCYIIIGGIQYDASYWVGNDA